MDNSDGTLDSWRVQRQSRKYLALLASALLFSACGDSELSPAEKERIRPGGTGNPLVDADIEVLGEALRSGESVGVRFLATYELGDQVDKSTEAEWVSSNPEIALVTAAVGGGAEIVGLKAGDFQIIATLDGGSAFLDYTVLPPKLLEMAFDDLEVSMREGGEMQLVLTGRFGDGSTGPVTAGVEWSSSNPTLVAVDDSGKVTGKGLGSATITAVSQGFTATLTVEVACSYPQSNGAIALGSTMPRVSWQNARRADGSETSFDIADYMCDSEAAYDTVLFVIGAEWCPNCPAYKRFIVDMEPQFESVGMKLIWVEVEDRVGGPADTETAERVVNEIVGRNDSGLRVGDADSLPMASTFRRSVRAFPTAFVVRTRDMAVIADQTASQRYLDILGLARNPEADF